MSDFPAGANVWEQPSASSARSLTITPSDTEDLTEIPRAITVNVSGIVKYINRDDSTAVDVYVAAGAMMSIRPRRIYAAGTAATGIVAHF